MAATPASVCASCATAAGCYGRGSTTGVGVRRALLPSPSWPAPGRVVVRVEGVALAAGVATIVIASGRHERRASVSLVPTPGGASFTTAWSF
jgi:hypothetical protein